MRSKVRVAPWVPALLATMLLAEGYHGPPDARHWIRFQDFRILRLDP